MTSPGRVCCDTPETQAHREWCIVGDQQAEFARGIAEGRRMERDAIVAWLRAEAVSHEATWGGRTVDFLETTASEVERGEHEKGSGE